MENKGLRVDMKKTTFLVSGVGHDVLQLSGECLCAVCCNCVGSNSILCPQCILWVHKTCSGITTRLVEEQNNICRMCKGEYLPINGRTVTEWISTAPCLMWKTRSDMLYSSGGCDIAIAVRCCVSWGMFRKLLPVLTTRHLSPSIHGNVFEACVCSVILHGSETWGPKITNCGGSTAMTMP